MNFNSHSNLTGTHAFLSASNYHWLNYDDEKLDQVFYTKMAAARGSRHHALAHELIACGIRLPDTTATMNLYVNDAIGFKMDCEVCLFYSPNAYGHADTISFRSELLRIHDLKTGVTEASFHQEEVYAALFCLEYRIRPFDIGMELRIYQNDSAKVYEPDPVDISGIMERIKYFDKRLNYLRSEES